jgi:parvulin-like peptidyl-prolyl isomerase
MLVRVLREPLTHFLGLALAIFALYGALNRTAETETGEIVVTTAKIEQLGGLFTKTWQRPPSAQELKGLIDDFVKEEIYNREALLIGLDKDDTVIRRRLRQKMEFLSDAEVDALTPTDAELESYLKANSDQFRMEPMTAFQQIYLSPTKRADAIDTDAQAILKVLLADAQTDPALFGDQTLLPSMLPLTAHVMIAQTFGGPFADELDAAAENKWSGPITSSYGLHLVRVTERRAGRSPALSEVRDAVVREWSNTKRKAFEQARIEDLLKRYRVTIESTAKVEAQR